MGKIEEAAEEGKEAIKLESMLDVELAKIYDEIKDLGQESMALAQAFENLWWGPLAKIISLISLNASEIEQVCHYTKLGTANIFTSPEKVPHFHYYNALSMNDPEEGSLFLSFLGDEKESDLRKSFSRGKVEEGSNTYLGCFLRASGGEEARNDHREDDLVMWRTYGKDEQNNDAAGCCMVIDGEFFKHDPLYVTSGAATVERESKTAFAKPSPEPSGEEDSPTISKNENNVKSQGASDMPEIEQMQLRQVVYYDQEREEFILNGIANAALQTSMGEFKKALEDLVSDFKQSQNASAVVDLIVYVSISKVRYFVKSVHYAFEKELRICRYEKPEDINVDFPEKIEIPRRAFVKSEQPIQPYIRKIMLGPKVSSTHRWLEMKTIMKKKGFEVEVTPSICKYQ